MTDKVFKIYKPKDLIYTAHKRCRCGAGLAYPRAVKDPFYFWACAYILTNDVKYRFASGTSGPFDAGMIQDEHGVIHDGAFSFVFSEFKNERDKSVKGQTTRKDVVTVKERRLKQRKAK